MKMLVLFSLMALAAAAPQNREPLRSNPEEVQILRYIADNIGLGAYKYGFEQTDGHKHDEEGQVINAGLENESIAVKGSYSWIGPDNVVYTVNYIADENGYQPTIEQGPGGQVPPGVVASLLG